VAGPRALQGHPRELFSVPGRQERACSRMIRACPLEIFPSSTASRTSHWDVVSSAASFKERAAEPSETAHAVATSVTASAWLRPRQNARAAPPASLESPRQRPLRVFMAVPQAMSRSADSTSRRAWSAERKEGSGKLTVPTRSGSPSAKATAGTQASSTSGPV
jgi:hypothetical protein